MALQRYKSYEITFTWGGVEPTCLTGMILSEVTQEVREVRLEGTWRRFRTSLQSFTIALEGIDQGAWDLFKAAGRTPIAFTIQTPDLEVDISGQAIVQTLNKRRTPQETFFSVNLQGHTAIASADSFDYLLLEDGDYLLLENFDKIILRP